MSEISLLVISLTHSMWLHLHSWCMIPNMIFAADSQNLALQELLRQSELDKSDLTSLVAERDLRLKSAIEAKQAAAAELEESTTAKEVRALPNEPVCASDAFSFGTQPCCGSPV